MPWSEMDGEKFKFLQASCSCYDTSSYFKLFHVILWDISSYFMKQIGCQENLFFMPVKL